MKSTKRLLGERIKELRKVRKLSQEQLSDKIGIDPKHLSRIEVGGSYPSLDRLEKIAHALGVEIKDCFEFEHLNETKMTTAEAVRMLRGADADKIKLIIRLMKAVLR